MKGIKKRKGILLILGLCILLTVGCGDISGKKEAAFPQEKYVVKWLMCGEKNKEYDKVFQRFNELLQEKFSDMSVEFELVPKGDYKNRWNMIMAANEPFDLAWIGADLFSFTEEIGRGSFTALDYLLSVRGEDLEADISQKLWERERYEGNTYAVPVKGELYKKRCMLTADRELMGKYGNAEKIRREIGSHPYTDDHCFKALEPFLQNLQKAKKLGTGASYKTLSNLADRGYEGIYGEDSPFVIGIFDEILTVYNKYELEAYRAYFQTMADWYEKGFLRGDLDDVLNPEDADGKNGGSALFLDFAGETEMLSAEKNIEYETVRIDLTGYDYIPYQSCQNTLVVPKSSENPDKAIELLNYLHTEKGIELYRLLVNGLETEHYKIEENGTVSRNRDGAGRLLYHIPPWNVGSTFQNFELTKGELARVEARNEQALSSPLEGFQPDIKMTAAELVKVNLVVGKYLDGLSRGTKDDWEVEYLEFLKQMREAGSGKIIQDLQHQIDEFCMMRQEK